MNLIATIVYCRNCGEPVQLGTSFCGKCGNALGNAEGGKETLRYFLSSVERKGYYDLCFTNKRILILEAGGRYNTVTTIALGMIIGGALQKKTMKETADERRKEIEQSFDGALHNGKDNYEIPNDRVRSIRLHSEGTKLDVEAEYAASAKTNAGATSFTFRIDKNQAESVQESFRGLREFLPQVQIRA